MSIQKFGLAAVVLACVALAGGVALRAQPGDQRAPKESRSAVPEKGDAPRGAVDETARKEIDALRKRVEALEQGQKLPAPARGKVVVTSPQAKDVVVARPFAARARAHRHINVSALVGGFVAEVAVKEGQAVKKGDALFKVLPTIYRAKLDAQLAEVQIAKVELLNAKNLFEKKVISERELALAEAKMARAEARARLAEAELNFTIVKAPFDGHVGRLLQPEGSLVKEGDALTTLSDTSVVWVYFDVPEARYLEFMADRDRIKVGAPVELVLLNGRAYPEVGKLGAIEGHVEPDTGCIPFRADFPNPKGLLRHGQTGTVLIREALKNVLVIPRRAAFEVRDKWYVYVVDKGGVAHRREIVIQSEIEDSFVVQKGLDVNEKVVLDGSGQVRDGEKVEYEFRKPEEVGGEPRSRPEE
jgi:membrane fusion protein (multidrug efflux system)